MWTLLMVYLSPIGCSGSTDKGAASDTGAADDHSAVPDESGAPEETGEPGESGESGETGASGDTDCETVTWLEDLDGDGFGGATAEGCEAPEDAAAVGGDCDDADATVHPDAEETCWDGKDNDCDGAAAGCAWEGAYSPADASGIWTGSGPDLFGQAVAMAGDLDGDGYGDLIASKQGYGGFDGAGSAVGWAWVLYGLAAPAGDMRSTSAGQFWQDEYLTDLAGAGDVDGDGYDDMVAAASAEDRRLSGVGVVYLIYGETTRLASGTHALADVADAALHGSAEYSYAGTTLSAGDLDADGLSDLAIGMPSNLAPGVALVAGPELADGLDLGAQPTIWGESWSAMGSNGTTVALGDLNGDGCADVALGAPWLPDYRSPTGHVYLVEGGAAALVGDLDAEHDADGAITALALGTGYTMLGWNLDVAGDVDGDGYQDLLVGDPYDRSSGSVLGATRLFLGGVDRMSGATSAADADWTLRGDSYAATGWYLTGVQDMDGDGAGDLVANGHAGVLLFYGGADLAGDAEEGDADATITSGAVDGFGHALAGHGDVNGDGAPDLAVGAASAGTYGAVYLFLGGGL